MTTATDLLKRLFAAGQAPLSERSAAELEELRQQIFKEEVTGERGVKELRATSLAAFDDAALEAHRQALARAELIVQRAVDRRVLVERAGREASAREQRAAAIALTQNAAARLHDVLAAERAASVAASQARGALEAMCSDIRAAFREIGERQLWDAIDCSPETLDDIDRLLRQALQTLGRETPPQTIPRDPRPAEGATRTYHGDTPHGRDEVFRSGRWVADHTGPRVL